MNVVGVSGLALVVVVVVVGLPVSDGTWSKS